MEEEAVRMYRREVARIQPLSKEHEADLIQKVREGSDPSERAARQLIEANLLLVLSIADRYSSTGLSMLELIQQGNLGLINAVKTFATDPAGDFSAYAAARIEDAICAYLHRSR